MVRSLKLPDCWIGAGFVRDAVWDYLHGSEPQPVCHDVDVIWFDPASEAQEDDVHRRALHELDPATDWEVANQAFMHSANGDSPYTSSSDAMRFWPETATAVAVRLAPNDTLEVSAPYGLADLFALRIRPTQRFADEKHGIFRDRIAKKRWLERYPKLRVCA